MIELVLGASASGKSEFAENRLCSLAANNNQTKYYIATMQPFGEEARARIRKHQKQRAGKGMVTIEQPLSIAGAVSKMQNDAAGRSVIAECMSNLLANEMFDESKNHPSDTMEDIVSDTAEDIIKDILTLHHSCENLIIVSNDVFSDGCEYDPLTQNYITQLGKLNCLIAQKADRVWEVICGIPVLRKGEEL